MDDFNNSFGFGGEPEKPKENDYNSFQQNAYQDTNNQSAGNYYTPPADSVFTPAFEQSFDAPAKKPKKKSRALVTIIIIAFVCFAVAGAGLVISTVSPNFSNTLTNKTESSESVTGGAEAEVKESATNSAKDEEGNLTTVGVAEQCKDSCVGITVYTDQTDYYDFYNYGGSSNSSGKVASGEGSGVIMAEENGKTYIMTCAHVIEDASSFTVTLENDKEYEAKMVGFDSQTDIGVLVINATGLKVAEFGDSKAIQVGQDCVAIGCPGGLQFKNSVTKGVVSALDVPVSSSIGYKNECIQVDAAINPGNSGGALFNMQGQVIGINSSKIASTEYEGMGFAVPSNTAVDAANSLIKNGYVAGRAKIGIEYNSLSNYTNAASILNALEKKGYKDAEGAMVIQTISDDSDLKDKDVQKYDMIVAVDGETLTTTDIVTSKLSDSKPGDTITLTIARVEGNSIKTFDVKCKLIESKQ